MTMRLASFLIALLAANTALGTEYEFEDEGQHIPHREKINCVGEVITCLDVDDFVEFNVRPTTLGDIPLATGWMINGSGGGVAQATDHLNISHTWGAGQTWSTSSTFSDDLSVTDQLFLPANTATGIHHTHASDSSTLATSAFTFDGVKVIIGAPNNDQGVLVVNNPVDNTSTALVVEAHKNNANKSGRMVFRSSRWSGGVIAPILINDRFGSAMFGAYESATPSWHNTIQIHALATENHDASNQGSMLQFQTVKTGSTTVAERMTIEGDGSVQVVEDFHYGGALYMTGIANVAFGASPYALGAQDRVVLCDPTGGNTTITLPACNAAMDGRAATLKHASASANTCTWAATGGDTIDAGTATPFAGNLAETMLCESGTTTWWAISDK